MPTVVPVLFVLGLSYTEMSQSWSLPSGNLHRGRGEIGGSALVMQEVWGVQRREI